MQLLKQIPMQTMCGRTHLAVWRNTRITQCGFIREPGPQKTEIPGDSIPKRKEKFSQLCTDSCSNSVNNNTLMAIKTESFSYLCLQAPCFHHYTDTKFAFPQHLSCLNVLFFLLKENHLTLSVFEYLQTSTGQQLTNS